MRMNISFSNEVDYHYRPLAPNFANSKATVISFSICFTCRNDFPCCLIV